MKQNQDNFDDEPLSEKYQCGNCGGPVVKIGAAPIAKGLKMAYRCVECDSRGSVKDQLRQELVIRGLEVNHD